MCSERVCEGHLRVVSLSKAHLLPTVLVKPRKRWLRPDTTEKLLTGMLNLNTNKQRTFTMQGFTLSAITGAEKKTNKVNGP